MNKKKIAIACSTAMATSVNGCNTERPAADGSLDAFKDELAQRMAAGEQVAITIGDDGNAKIVNIDAVREQQEIKRVGIRDLKALLKPMPLELLRNGANRNKPCPCGSGLKFKKCCWLKSEPITIEP